jgi:hypothetical protein
MILMMGLSKLDDCQSDVQITIIVRILLQQNVLRLQIAMYQLRFPQKGEAVDQLLREDSYEGRRQAAELVLLDQFVQIDTEEFEDEAEMLAVDEGIFQPQ